MCSMSDTKTVFSILKKIDFATYIFLYCFNNNHLINKILHLLGA